MAPIVLILVVGIMILGAAAMVAFGVQTTRAHAATPEMESRLERYGHVSETLVSSNEPARSGSFMANQLESAVQKRSSTNDIRTSLARADIRMTVGEWLLLRAASAAGASVIGLLMGRTSVGLAVLFGIVMAGFGWMVPQIVLNFKAGRRRQAFNNQLGDTIGLMANSLRAGYSLLQTMELIARESPAPMSQEFSRVVREVGLGISYQDGLDNLLRRVPSEDLDLLISAIKIQSEVGGNLGQILDVIGETIRERVRIQGEIRTLTAQGSLSAYVITGLPVALAVGLFLLNPEYIGSLFNWPWICIPIGAAFMEIIGFIAMKKVIAIEV